jgi:hypothetical protein
MITHRQCDRTCAREIRPPKTNKQKALQEEGMKE